MKAPMGERQAFRAAVLAAPTDDLRRLAYADWLDEAGDPADAARAAFIRGQIEDYGAKLAMGGVRGEELVYRRGFVADVRCRLADWIGGVCDPCAGTGTLWGRRAAETRCGECGGTGWLAALGPRLARDHPLERVRVRDRRSEGEGFGVWHRRPGDDGPDEEHHLPPEVFDRLPGVDGSTGLWRATFIYPGADEALTAALLSWAKARPADSTVPMGSIGG